jgi:hypothetical protein
MAAYFDGMSAAAIEKLIGLQASAFRLQEQFNKLKDFRAYYAGAQPSMLSERQEEFLGTILTGSLHPVVFNLCAVVIDVLRERLKVEGFHGAAADRASPLAELVWQWWQAANMDVEQNDVYRRALR